MEDMVAKRKERLRKLLGAAHYALGGMVEDSEDQMEAMDMGEDDFLSDESDDSMSAEDSMAKRKARLFAQLGPKMKKR